MKYGRRGDKQKITEAFGLGDLNELSLEISLSYNIAPATMQPVIVADDETGDRALRIMRWGLIPPWTQSLKGFKLTTINAKVEDIKSKPLWREPFEHRRCLVPADLFYESRLTCSMNGGDLKSRPSVRRPIFPVTGAKLIGAR